MPVRIVVDDFVWVKPFRRTMRANEDLFGGEQPASNPTGNVCPPKRILQDDPVNRTVPAGGVQGGKLSYPQLGAPWGSVMLEDRVPFGRDGVQRAVEFLAREA